MADNIPVKRSDKAAKVLLIIPLIFAVLSVLCFIGGCVLEEATSRGIIYTVLMLGAFAFFGLEIIPGGILALIGTVRAAKTRMIGFLVLGIIEVIGAVLSSLIIIIIVFIAGPGV